ncbi:MAG: aminopeptidase [Faecalibacterium sp.]
MNQVLLEKYADFIVRVGVNVQAGQTMIVNCNLNAAELCRLCVKSAFAAGAADVRVDWSDESVSRMRMEHASEETLCDVKPYVQRSYLDYAESEGGVCVLHLIADDPEVFAGLDASKLNRVSLARRLALKTWRTYTMNDKVQWCIAAMPSAAWASKIYPELAVEEAMEKLWDVIFDVCRVTNGDPVNEWKAHVAKLVVLRDKMNALHLESIHMTSNNGTDLTVGMADGAIWDGAASVDDRGTLFIPNLPTEEIFTAPHKDKVNGVVYGTKPYVYNGQLIKGFRVTFKDGKVIDHDAEENAALLGELLDSDEGARRIGEIALVPNSSPINQSGVLFYDTLFDENAACHIAFGASYPGTTKGGKAMSEDELLSHGMNQSAIHEDVMVGAADMLITGLTNAGEMVKIFENGEWVLA